MTDENTKYKEPEVYAATFESLSPRLTEKLYDAARDMVDSLLMSHGDPKGYADVRHFVEHVVRATTLLLLAEGYATLSDEWFITVDETMEQAAKRAEAQVSQEEQLKQYLRANGIQVPESDEGGFGTGTYL